MFLETDRGGSAARGGKEAEAEEWLCVYNKVGLGAGMKVSGGWGKRVVHRAETHVGSSTRKTASLTRQINLATASRQVLMAKHNISQQPRQQFN